ncbi:MAG: extracellular solute-binding protein [Streptomycetaceae bacterium]|nr:MAG: extracellular solute-binding protein [Streptomycetaceae bacterium]
MTTERFNVNNQSLTGGLMKKKFIVASVLAVALALAGCSSSSDKTSASSESTVSDAPVTLTLWHNLGDTQNGVAVKALTEAYTALHPNVTFNLVSQPADNYFALLQAAAVSKTGPDLALMWCCLFIHKSYLANLKGLVPDEALARMGGLEWTADNFDIANGPNIMLTDRQFYMGFYNKEAFTKAGVTSVPKTWDELYAACGKLKSSGYTPMVYGNGGQSLGALYYPWYDSSYITIGQASSTGFRDLYSGKNQWDSPSNVAAYEKYAALKTKGCTNSDILTKTNNMDDFLGGKAAMIIDGTWDTQKFTDKFGDKVGAFVPPFSDAPMTGVVQMAGQGISIMKYSKNITAAAGFVTFMTTDEASAIFDKAGLIPNVIGSTTSNPVNKEMLAFTETGGLTAFPMLDNVIQGDVVDAGNKIIPSILAGKIKPAAALKQLRQVWEQLAADAKTETYKLPD